MSRLVRVSDDIYSALEIMQPDGWSMPKTIDAMLRPVINAISRVVTENEDSQEEFPVRVKKITEENAHLVSNLHSNLGGLYRMNGYPDLAKEYMEKGISVLQKLSGIIKEYLSDDCLNYAKVQETLATIYLMTANLSHAKTHFKKAFKIYEKILADEPEMIEAKYREIQELYPQIGFSIGKTLSGLLTKQA